MINFLPVRLAILMSCGLLFSAQAIAATYTFTKITIPGGYHVQAAGLNDFGTVVGTYLDRKTARSVGFRMDGTLVAPLPPSKELGIFASIYPTAINFSGQILASACEGSCYGLVYTGEAESFSFPLGAQFSNGSEDASLVGLGTDAVLLVQGTLPDNGTPGKVTTSIATPAGVAAITAPHGGQVSGYSINASNFVAGLFMPQSGAIQPFIVQGNVTTFITVPGAVSVSGGVISDRGAVAGSFVDASGYAHLWTYANGRVNEIFPNSRHKFMQVVAFNSAGAIAYLTDGRNRTLTYGYVLIPGQGVLGIGSWIDKVQPHVSMNNRNRLVLAVSNAYNGDASSFVGTCGC